MKNSLPCAGTLTEEALSSVRKGRLRGRGKGASEEEEEGKSDRERLEGRVREVKRRTSRNLQC